MAKFNDGVAAAAAVVDVEPEADIRLDPAWEGVPEFGWVGETVDDGDDEEEDDEEVGEFELLLNHHWLHRNPTVTTTAGPPGFFLLPPAIDGEEEVHAGDPDGDLIEVPSAGPGLTVVAEWSSLAGSMDGDDQDSSEEAIHMDQASKDFWDAFLDSARGQVELEDSDAVGENRGDDSSDNADEEPWEL